MLCACEGSVPLLFLGLGAGHLLVLSLCRALRVPPAPRDAAAQAPSTAFAYWPSSRVLSPM
jgi:hypothetical protein